MDAEIENLKPPKMHILYPRKIKPVTKGVGGFRPVINWRDISYRRKRLADRQILLCVIGTGVLMVILGICVLIFGLYVIAEQCPFQWSETTERCLLIPSHNLTWPAGRDLCIEKGAEMLQFTSNEQTTEITPFLKEATWIGLYRNHRQPNFQWENGAKLSFTNWGSTPRATPPAFTECAQVDLTGKWSLASSCRETLNVICMYRKTYSALVLIGPVIIFCGLLVMVLSAEICHRQHTLSKKGRILIEETDIEPQAVDIKKETLGSDNPAFIAFVSTPNSPPSSTLKSPEDATAIVTSASDQENPSTSNIAESPHESQAIDVKTADLLKSPVEDQSQSQEKLELLLTPRNLNQ